MSGKSPTGDTLISKHERLVTSLLRPCGHGEVYGDLRVNKAAGSCALACKHSGRTFAQLVKRLNLNAADVKRLEKVGIKGFFARHGVSDLYRPATPNRATLALESESLYFALQVGPSPLERERIAAWIKWMVQFVPDEAYQQRRAELDPTRDLM